MSEKKSWPGKCPECGKRRIMLAQSVVCEDPDCGKKVVEEWSDDETTQPLGPHETWFAMDHGWVSSNYDGNDCD